MQTTTLLTDQDIKILRDLKEPDGISSKAVLVMGIILLAVSVVLGIIAIPETILLIMDLFVLLLGAGITIAGLVLRRKTDTYFNNPPHGNMKQVVTDRLLRMELLNKQLVRYYFNGYSLDLYIACGHGYHPSGFRHKRPIDEVKALSNTPVKLSYVEYMPGEKVLLDITYSQHTAYTETVLPITEEDIKKSLSGNAGAMGCILGVAVVLGIVLGFITHFDGRTFPLILCFGVGPLIIIGVGAIGYSSWKAKQAKNKIVIRTTITEAIIIWVKSGKSSTKNTFYRLGDGTLIHITNIPFQPGDNVLIQFLQNNNGTRGFPIEMVRI